MPGMEVGEIHVEGVLVDGMSLRDWDISTERFPGPALVQF